MPREFPTVRNLRHDLSGPERVVGATTWFSTYTPLPSCLPITQRHAARRSAGCCFIHSASCGAPIRHDCIETSAKSDVVTVCSEQLAGEERLQSTAMILIMMGNSPRCDGHQGR